MSYINNRMLQINREKVFKPTCELCNGLTVLVHHKDFTNYNHSSDNLQSLCRECHLRLHWERKRADCKVAFLKILTKVQSREPISG